MRISHIVPAFDLEATGPSYSVPRLCESIAAQGHPVELLTCRAGPPVSNVGVLEFPPWRYPPGFAISPALAHAVRQRTRTADIVHNHSLWSMANIAAGLLVGGKGAALVLSPRGTLAPWALAHSRWKKRLVWPVQKRALFAAALVNATSESEVEDIREVGYRGPIALLPNGIDVPPEDHTPVNNRSSRRLIFLSRLHKKKGIENLLAAWSSLQGDFPDWSLSVIGTGEPNYERFLQNEAHRLALKRVDFPGPIYGAEKKATYRGAGLFVLPTHSENFGMVVAEALAHGCPAIVTKGAPWGGLEKHGCGWWIDFGVEPLSLALRDAMSRDQGSLRQMGQRGQEWMLRDFSWDTLGRKMLESYSWIRSGGTRPAWIEVV